MVQKSPYCFSCIDAVFAPVKLRYTAMDFTSAVLAWATPAGSCVHYYTVHIHNHICELIHNSTTADTTLNVSGLTRGVEYTVTVYGVYNDEAGMRATTFMNLDGKVVFIIVLSMYKHCLSLSSSRNGC